MTAGDLIKMLQVVDPSQVVEFSIGGALDENYRRKCAKVELRGGDCLNYLRADGAVIYCDGDTPFLTITLEQTNWPSDGFKKKSRNTTRNTRKGKSDGKMQRLLAVRHSMQ